MRRPVEAGWLYLHFLDRELLTTSGLYGALSMRRLHDDFLLSLLSITEPAYISTSVLFESDYAFELFRRHGAVFSRQDILRLAGGDEHLGGFVLRKREDYSAERDSYSRYFADVWKDVEDRAPTVAVKPRDTTAFLRRRVGQRLLALPATLRADLPCAKATCPSSFVDHLGRALETSGNAPVIGRLFEPVFREDAAPDAWRYHARLQISFAYVESYILDYGGTIPTGLRCGLRAFECLSRTPHIHCLDVWREVYTTLGVYPRVLAASADDLVHIRDHPAHASFVRAVRRALESEAPAAPPARSTGGACEPWHIGQRLTRCLPRRSFDGSRSFVGFVQDVLQRASDALGAGAAEEREDRAGTRAARDEPRFYLDGEQGILKSTDGREIALDERVVRVLMALAGDLPGLGRLGKLSDEAIASLYTGERRAWAAAEAAKITYQFTRSLRRTLSRAGIHARDAIVRRQRGRGVAMGTRWAPRAVRGKSEVGLLLGRRRDVRATCSGDRDDG